MVLKTIIDKYKLIVLVGNNLDKIEIKSKHLNRPGLELINELEHFQAKRIQIIGFLEHAYLEKHAKNDFVEKYLEKKPPVIIYCRGIMPSKFMIEKCEEYDIPLLITDKETTPFISQLSVFLGHKLAKKLSIHGVFMEIFGKGILLRGKSGIGKSEIALDLISKGHSLVGDDHIQFSKYNDEIVGHAPDLLLGKLEIRGVGIVDIKKLYGTTRVTKELDLRFIIEIVDEELSSFDRIGNKYIYEEILGTKVPKIRIPLRAGRNYATIIETAVANWDLKENYGHDTSKIFLKEVIDNNLNSKS